MPERIVKPFARRTVLRDWYTAKMFTPSGSATIDLETGLLPSNGRGCHCPYGVNDIPGNGGLPSKHLLLSVFINRASEKGENPYERQHTLIAVHLPNIGQTYVCGDGLDSCGRGNLVFLQFYQFKTAEEDSKNCPFPAGTILSGLRGIKQGGYLAIPNDIGIIRKIGFSARRVSQEEWNKGPWIIHDRSVMALDGWQRARAEDAGHTIPELYPRWDRPII